MSFSRILVLRGPSYLNQKIPAKTHKKTQVSEGPLPRLSLLVPLTSAPALDCFVPGSRHRARHRDPGHWCYGGGYVERTWRERSGKRQGQMSKAWGG